MDDQSTPKPDKIMDIQPPTPQSGASEAAQPAVSESRPVAPDPVPQPNETSPAVTAEPDAVASETSPADPSDVKEAATASDSSTGAKQAETSAKAGPDPVPKPSDLAIPLGDKSAHQHGFPVKTVIVAAIIALVLVGLSVYAFQKTKKVDKPASSGVSTTSQKAATTTAVKSSDVAQASQSIDTTLKQVDDSKDLNTNDLSDATLGL